MKRFYIGATTALAMIGFTAGQANAQGFRGVRVEAQAGLDRFYSEGNHHDKLGWGGAAGVDFDLGGFILGPEATFWWAPNENETVEGGGLARRKSFEEWALALRAGVMVTPSTLVYAKAGYVRNEQRKEFIPIDVAGNLGGATTPGYYYDHYKTNGW